MKVSLITDQDYLPALLQLLSKARRQIDIMAFSFAIGSASGKLNVKSAPYQVAKHLKDLKAKNEELKVRLYIEGIRETHERNRVTADFLTEAGVEVVYGATHAKGFCIDGRYVLFGSTNLTNQSMMKNNEANLLIEDEEVALEFTSYFEHHWKGGGHGGITLPGPLLADGDFKDVLIDMIKRAKKKIGFSIYFFNHRDIERALVEAHERGVEVVGFIHQHRAFALPYIRANRATVKRMRSHGMEELYFGPPGIFSHAKYLIVDQREIALGTGNWLVEDVEVHPQLYVHLKAPTVAKELAQHLAQEIAEQATDD